MNLGNVYWDQDKLEEAEAKYREALPLASGSESPERLGDVLSNLAGFLLEKGAREGAHAAATDAVTAYENVGSDKETGARKLLGEIEASGDYSLTADGKRSRQKLYYRHATSAAAPEATSPSAVRL